MEEHVPCSVFVTGAEKRERALPLRKLPSDRSCIREDRTENRCGRSYKRAVALVAGSNGCCAPGRWSLSLSGTLARLRVNRTLQMLLTVP